MNANALFRFIAAALAMAWFAGCSTLATPESRIRNNPEAFKRLDPDQQALVRAGKVTVGMDMDAVRIALGVPNRVTYRTDTQGQTQTWHYFSSQGRVFSSNESWGNGGGGEWDPQGLVSSEGGWVGGGGGVWSWGPESYGERHRIEFRNGKVDNLDWSNQSGPPSEARSVEKQFPYVIDFVPYSPEWGQFSPCDEIVITVVRSDRNHIEPGGRYLVEGTYKLASMERAMLGLSVTAPQPR